MKNHLKYMHQKKKTFIWIIVDQKEFNNLWLVDTVQFIRHLSFESCS
jgi:hypothetical protein